MKNTEQSRDPVSGDIYTHVGGTSRLVIIALTICDSNCFDVLKFTQADYSGLEAMRKCELAAYYKRTGHVGFDLDVLEGG